MTVPLPPNPTVGILSHRPSQKILYSNTVGRAQGQRDNEGAIALSATGPKFITGPAVVTMTPPHVSGYGRELSNLAKIYTDKAKYSSEDDSFDYKLTIFQDICAGADVTHEAKLKAFPTMLKGLGLDYYCSNVSIGVSMPFDEVCTKDQKISKNIKKLNFEIVFSTIRTKNNSKFQMRFTFSKLDNANAAGNDGDISMRDIRRYV